MKYIKTAKFNDVYFIEWKNNCIFDAYEFYSQIGYNFVQENEVVSKRNVLRGMGFQLFHPQGKLLRVVSGEIYDVIVDIKVQSNMFAQWSAFHLSEYDSKWLWIPPGYAHGYLALRENTKVVFKCTEYFDPTSEAGFLWNDEFLSIKWPINSENIILSKRDSRFPTFCECMNYVISYKK